MIHESNVMKYLCGRTPLSVESYDTVSHALDLMGSANENAIGVHNFGKFSGIFTEADFIKRVLYHKLNPGTTSVYDVMTPHPETISPNCSILEAYSRMIRRGISHLPVIDKNSGFKGIVTEEDLRPDIQDLMDKTHKEYKMIVGYIHGENYGLCSYN